MNNELKDLLRSVIREELTPINERFDRLEAEVNTIKNEQQTVKQAVIEMSGSLNHLEEEQQLIKQAVLETKETVKRLEAIQEKQHRLIEMLSARSIEQEAVLKRI